MNDYLDRFGGIARLYGDDGLARLRGAHVAVIGVGGVGSWTVEALARSGVGRLTLIDLDDICITNTNRQLPAVTGAFGRMKVDALAERVGLIAPECIVEPVQDFFGPDTAEALLAPGYDFVVDAIDALPAKLVLVRACVERGLPLVVSGGAGGRRSTAAVSVSDLNRTNGDALLKRLRKILRRDYEFLPDVTWGIPTVFSAESPWFPDGECGVAQRAGEQSLRMDCASGLGAATFVTGAFGFATASVVVTAIATGQMPHYTALSAE